MTKTTATENVYNIVLDAYNAHIATVDGLDFHSIPDGNYAVTIGDEALVIGWDCYDGECGYTWTTYADLAADDIITTDGGEEAEARAALAEWIKSRKATVTLRIPVTASDDAGATIESLIAQALEQAADAGLADVAYLEHGAPRTSGGYRSVDVLVSTSTPAEYDRASDQIILL